MILRGRVRGVWMIVTVILYACSSQAGSLVQSVFWYRI